MKGCAHNNRLLADSFYSPQSRSVMFGIIMNRLITSILISTFLYMPICHASEVSHPPTFQQMKDASSGESCDDAAVYEALKYTDIDVKHLTSQNDINYIIGAAYQYDKSNAISFLNKYLPLIENNPIGLSLFISCALQEDDPAKNIDLEHLTEQLIKIDSGNGYVYYLKAYYYSKLNNADKCLYYMQKANSAGRINNYFTELSNISIKTSLFLGYSKFAAQSYALGLQHDIMIVSGLSQYLSQMKGATEFQIECMKMGVILRNNSKTLLSDLLSYAVQIRALKEMRGKEYEIKATEKKRKESLRILETANAIDEKYNIPEKRQIQYFDDLYSKSETYAILKLLKEYPVNTK